MTATHEERHPRAGQTVKLRPGVMLYDYPRDEWLDGADIRFMVQDWADRLLRQSWLDSDLGNPTVFAYAARVAKDGLPEDEEVVGGKNLATGLTYMVHVSELAE